MSTGVRSPRSRRRRHAVRPSSAGHEHVEHDHVGRDRLDRHERLVAVDRGVHVVALEAQRPHEGVADALVVLGHEDARRIHGLSLARRRKSPARGRQSWPVLARRRANSQIRGRWWCPAASPTVRPDLTNRSDTCPGSPAPPRPPPVPATRGFSGMQAGQGSLDPSLWHDRNLFLRAQTGLTTPPAATSTPTCSSRPPRRMPPRPRRSARVPRP